jgi:hypothetical protein
MNNKKGFDKLEIWVISGAIATLVITLVVIVYSISTVSNELYQAFSFAQPSTPTVDFNISSYNSLGL